MSEPKEESDSIGIWTDVKPSIPDPDKYFISHGEYPGSSGSFDFCGLCLPTKGARQRKQGLVCSSNNSGSMFLTL